ncbi:MAG: molybdopterin oxidoreductase [Bdellovibrionales bacterium CG10_big_fil_rev_8_21_14_0_10_45_34]|nr:MAG: molybdopterin oxidoreductase [Bdellovibrionales bacterium CG10_big_fil_rev_8_21_14_0_10_45_34]
MINNDSSKYWRELNPNLEPELAKTLEEEFQSSPLASGDGKDGVARRDFLKLMGASLALSTTSCIRRPVQKIVPYVNRPAGLIPGVSQYYSSSWSDGGSVYGLIVKTREGKPIKFEGNPAFAVNGGALSARAQAHLLSVYDPDRLKDPAKVSGGTSTKVTWDQLDEDVSKKLSQGGVYFLTSSIPSPSTRMLISDFSSAFGAKHVAWDPLGQDQISSGQKESYGSAIMPRYRFHKARMIVSVECDFLGTWISPVEFARDFSVGRAPNSTMSKFVAFESNLSMTGANADLRVRIKASQQVHVILGLAHEIAVKKGLSRYAGAPGLRERLAAYAKAHEKLGIEEALWSRIADDLWAHRGQSLIVAGGLSASPGVGLQIAANLLNSILENDGKTIDYSEAPYVGFQSSYEDIKGLIRDMQAGKVKTLMIHKLNPAYVLGSNSGFVEACKNVPTIIYTGSHFDETAKLATYLAPDNHDIEDWSDAEAQKGVYVIQQPTIRPLGNTRSFQMSLINWAYMEEKGPKRLLDAENWYDYFTKYWMNQQRALGRPGSFEDFWHNFLQTGVVDVSGAGRDKVAAARSFRVSALDKISVPKDSNSLELVLYSSVSLGDGSDSNIAWLQELPDPVTKLVWDSYLSVSPERAKQLGVKSNQVVSVKTATGEMKLPVWVQPGLHDDVVAVAVGQGRDMQGRVANGVGANAFKLVDWSNDSSPVSSGLEVNLTVTSEISELACTQGHHSMEGRQIVVEATLDHYLKDNNANIHRHKITSIWSAHEYKGYKWGMAVDLSSCIGCNACMTACQSENNIPVVGKKYVLQGREMHWIRIDRYYVGNESNPDTVFQPVMCQHCDHAPCETVCPVAATTHSPEGINEMTYNRCVGTRYCSNNCPYKVRRFNWFSYIKESSPISMTQKPRNMALNPEVTVRSRGVMEKCTFCVQRIHEAKNHAKNENRKLQDGEVKTACQQTCPTGALIFGDMNDPNTQVSKLFKEQRTYSLLEEWNAQPSVRYMTKVRNTEHLKGAPAHHATGKASHSEPAKAAPHSDTGSTEKGSSHEPAHGGH